MQQPQAFVHPVHSGTSQTVMGGQPGQPLAMVTVVQPGLDKKLIINVEGHRTWTNEMFSCCDECTSNWFLLPCWMMDMAVRIKEPQFMPCVVPAAGIAMRTKIRSMGGIKGSICNDCIAMTCCWSCAVCQMERELTAMGL